MTINSPTGWRCACCSWHLKSSCMVRPDASRAYVRRVRRWADIPRHRDDGSLCIWCFTRLESPR